MFVAVFCTLLWLTLSFTNQVTLKGQDWLLSSRSHVKRVNHGGGVVAVVVSVSPLCVCMSKANYCKAWGRGPMKPQILPHSNPNTQRRPVITMMTLMHNISTTERAPMSLKNPQSLPNPGTRRYTPKLPCLARCAGVFLLSRIVLKLPRTLPSQRTPAPPTEPGNGTTNPITLKNPTINITLRNQLTNMAPVRKLPSGELTSKLSRTIPKGQNPSQ